MVTTNYAVPEKLNVIISYTYYYWLYVVLIKIMYDVAMEFANYRIPVFVNNNCILLFLVCIPIFLVTHLIGNFRKSIVQHFS